MPRRARDRLGGQAVGRLRQHLELARAEPRVGVRDAAERPLEQDEHLAAAPGRGRRDAVEGRLRARREGAAQRRRQAAAVEPDAGTLPAASARPRSPRARRRPGRPPRGRARPGPWRRGGARRPGAARRARGSGRRRARRGASAAAAARGRRGRSRGRRGSSVIASTCGGGDGTTATSWNSTPSRRVEVLVEVEGVERVAVAGSPRSRRARRRPSPGGGGRAGSGARSVRTGPPARRPPPRVGRGCRPRDRPRGRGRSRRRWSRGSRGGGRPARARGGRRGRPPRPAPPRRRGDRRRG